MPFWCKLLILIGIATIISSCQGHRATDFLWPELGDSYIQTTSDWTRQDSLHSGLDTMIIARATYKSPEWMQAYAEKKASDYGLTEDEKTKLQEDLQYSLQQETEIFLALFKGDKARSRLVFEDPLWSIFVLKNDKKLYPLEVRESREPLAKLKSFYPYANRWQDHYVLRFPALQADSFELVMSGPLGRIELSW
ncbi:hypothetical protein [Desulfonatronospira sp.]|uniref:hypothetical protein n=1 Tax=Desulfonatronospira sp. TaxID=1962951 RepID=UPI0025C3C963|nr:hypothetical protein [Desulfonatronospira sp.]